MAKRRKKPTKARMTSEERFQLTPKEILKALKDGISVEAVAMLTGVCERTMRTWLSVSRTGLLWRRWKQQRRAENTRARHKRWRDAHRDERRLQQRLLPEEQRTYPPGQTKGRPPEWWRRGMRGA